MIRFIIPLFVAMLCASCATQARRVPLRTAFDSEAHAPYSLPGSATVTGQAFQRTVGGEVRYAAGRTVELLPATSYGREILSVLRSGKRVENFDPVWRDIVRRTTANGQGEFVFREVPAGDWYVLTWNTWNAGGSYLWQGGYLGQLVSVPPDGTVESIITGPPW